MESTYEWNGEGNDGEAREHVQRGLGIVYSELVDTVAFHDARIPGECERIATEDQVEDAGDRICHYDTQQQGDDDAEDPDREGLVIEDEDRRLDESGNRYK